MKTIGIVANVLNEIHALPGWIESAVLFADHVSVYHAGPGGAYSTDGTIELLEKWHIPITFGSIDEGFGTVRTKTVRTSPCEFVICLDADERFNALTTVLTCEGDSPVPDVSNQVLQEYDTPTPGVCPWNWENAGMLMPRIKVTPLDAYNQGAWLRDIIEKDIDAVISIRRQWRDFTMTNPSQNWRKQPDFQTRIVRNDPSIFWVNRMHESLRGAARVESPNFTHGPFFEHHHLFFKEMNPSQS